jgi:hypothetical protein
MTRSAGVIILVVPFFFFACDSDDGVRLPPVEQRVTEAIAGLRSELLAPDSGWKLEYKPTNESGVFFMLLKFEQDGTVRIRSDVAENGGEFYDQTISWRIDNALGLELILETYGVFHYLFEQDGATFGAEFEFEYVGKQGSSLVFRSASDVFGVPSLLTFNPAASGDDGLFARDIAANLNAFATISPKALESPVPKQQIILENAGISILWSLDPAKRIIRTILAGAGTDFEEGNFNGVLSDHTSGYKLESGKLVLLDPVDISINAQTHISFDAISFTDFSFNGPGFCSASPGNGPEYTGQIDGIGPVSMVASLFDPEGADFQPIEEFPYSVNSVFIFNDAGESLSDEGNLLDATFPEAVAFLFYYGYVSDSLPSHAAGFVLDHPDGNAEIILREFVPASTSGNKVRVLLTDQFYFSGTPSAAAEDGLRGITDILFEGENLYASDYPVEGLTVFKLFNPCNRYEIFLVQ